MGYRMVKFNVTPEENEQIDAIIKVSEETRSVFHGIVIDKCNRPIHNAVVKLLIMDCKNKHLEPVTHTFTDENGEFLFGPLCAHVQYVIKVWTNHVKTREIVICPDECEEECLHHGRPSCSDKPPCNDKPSDAKQTNDYLLKNTKVRPKVIMKNGKNFIR